MACTFVSEAPRLREDVARALRRQDAEALRRAAHALKGAALNFGGDATAAAASGIERLAATGDLAGAAALQASLEQELAALVTMLGDVGGASACAS